MRTYVLSHLTDTVLLHDLDALVAHGWANTAAVLAHIAEADGRRLYLGGGYSSMFDYSVRKLRFSEDAAYKRIQAARAARRFPAIFAALADGRLHLAAVCLLAPHLTPENADELLMAAAHKTKAEVEQILARRFPRTELLPLVQVIPASPPLRNELAPGQVETEALAGATHGQLAPGQVEPRTPRPKVAPLAPDRFALQFTIDKEAYDDLQYVQALLSHRLPSGDVAQVFGRALKALRNQLERRKFAATTRPRPRSCGPSANPRHIPAHVKRAVWQRDRGQCAFVGEGGQRCPSRKFLEFDHLEPVARGGRATVENLSLRCRSHNQLAAERVFGAGFMSEKRHEARHAAAQARTWAAAEKAQVPDRAAEAEIRSQAVAREHARDLMSGLRNLGCRADEARRAVEFCETIPDATLEEKFRAALRFLCPKTRFQGRVGTSPEGAQT